MGNLLGTTFSFAITGALFFLYGAALWGVHKRLLKAYANKPAEQYRRQLIWLGTALFGLVLVIVVIPVGDAMQGQLLGLLGIVLSATIALSSTTIVGNALAGLMLKSLKKIRPGNYIEVEGHGGRVSEMDLLHTEIQTENRDLTTFPNLYLVTHPVRVLQDSGTILSVDVSLGYDAPRRRVESLLLSAATKTGLKDPYVQIRELGDFSVIYQVSGLSEDIEHLLSNRRRLRASTLDELHAGGIEVVSPNFMNTRTLEPGSRILPPVEDSGDFAEPDVAPDAVVFDKAQQAESLEELRQQRDALVLKIEPLETALKEFSDPESEGCRAAENTLNTVRKKVELLDNRISAAEARIAGS
jgi:small-conductance mechanosensitive channel